MPIRALIFKELRSAALTVSVSAAVYFVWLLWLMGVTVFSTPSPAPEADYWLARPDGALVYALLTGTLCLALGMNATRSESLGKCWQFALFRPVSRRTLISVKIAVGVVLSSVLSLLPLLAYFAWARSPGALLSPFDASFLWPTGVVWLWSPVMFLAGFLMTLREARWWGSKSWPILSVVCVGFFLWFMPVVEPFRFQLSWKWLCWSELLSVVALVTSLLSVAEEQDFS